MSHSDGLIQSQVYCFGMFWKNSFWGTIKQKGFQKASSSVAQKMPERGYPLGRCLPANPSFKVTIHIRVFLDMCTDASFSSLSFPCPLPKPSADGDPKKLGNGSRMRYEATSNSNCNNDAKQPQHWQQGVQRLPVIINHRRKKENDNIWTTQ